jgi:hypothetical protein
MFWNEELQTLRQARNKRRTQVRRARRAGCLTSDTISAYSTVQRDFHHAYKRAKTDFMMKKVNEAIQDPT